MRFSPLHLVAFAASAAAQSIIFENATIVAFDESTEEFKILRDSSLLIENDRITRISEGAIPQADRNNNPTVIDATNKIITPGFVDTHHHVWETLFKTLGANVDLYEYFQRYGATSPASSPDGGFTPDDTYLSQLAGFLEMISEGTTTVIDHAHADFSDEHAFQLVNATFDSGIRSFYAHVLQDYPDPNNYTVDEQLDVLQSLANDSRFAESNYRVSLGLAYDNFTGTTPEFLDTLLDITRDGNLSLVTTHYAPNVIKLLDESGWLNSTAPVVFAHASVLTPEEADILRTTDQYMSTTPESEFSYGILDDYQVNIMDQGSLGLDTHITFSSGMIAQARLWLQTLRYRRYSPILNTPNETARGNPMSVRQAFSLMTRHGGLALKRPDIGVITEGAKADIVVFRTDTPTLLGWNDPIAAVVLHSNPGDIEHVLIDGTFVKRDFQLTFDGYAQFRERFLVAADRVQQQWLAIDWPVADPTGTDTIPIDTQRGDGTGY